MVKKADTVLNSVNAGQRTKPYYEKEEEMVADSGQKRLMTSRPFTQDDVKKAPPVAYEIRYVYKNRAAPITMVVIDLQEPARLLMVAGTSSDHVDALFSMLQSSISDYGTWLGGFYLYMLTLGLAAIPLSLVAGLLLRRHFERTLHDATYHLVMRSLLFLSAVVIGGVSGFLILGINWFPQVSVYKGEASFIVRRAPEIQIFGILVTMCLSLLGLYYTRSGSRRKASPGEPKNPPNG